jgi:hypothetical protein
LRIRQKNRSVGVDGRYGGVLVVQYSAAVRSKADIERQRDVVREPRREEVDGGLFVLEEAGDLGLRELHPAAVEIIVDQDLYDILQKGAAKGIEFPRVRSRILLCAAAVS